MYTYIYNIYVWLWRNCPNRGEATASHATAAAAAVRQQDLQRRASAPAAIAAGTRSGSSCCSALGRCFLLLVCNHGFFALCQAQWRRLCFSPRAWLAS